MDDPALEILRDAKHSPSLKQGLLKLYQEKTLCDVTLTSSDGVELQAHWLVLSVHSEFLRHLAISRNIMQFLTTDSGSLKLNIETEVLRTILDYLYSGDLVVTKHNLDKIKQAAKVLQLSRALVLLEQSHVSSNQSTDAESRVLQPTSTPTESSCSKARRVSSETGVFQPLCYPNEFKSSRPITMSATTSTPQPSTASSNSAVSQSMTLSDLSQQLQPTILSVTSLSNNSTINMPNQQTCCSDRSSSEFSTKAGTTVTTEEIQSEIVWQNLRNVSTSSLQMDNSIQEDRQRNISDNHNISMDTSNVSDFVQSPLSHSEHEPEEQSVVDVLTVTRKRGRPAASLALPPVIVSHKRGRPEKLIVSPYSDRVATNGASESIPAKDPRTRSFFVDPSSVLEEEPPITSERTPASNERPSQIQSPEVVESTMNLAGLVAVKIEPVDEYDEANYSVYENTHTPESEEERSQNSASYVSPVQEGKEISVHMTQNHGTSTETSFHQENRLKRKRQDTVNDTRTSFQNLAKTVSQENSNFRVSRSLVDMTTLAKGSSRSAARKLQCKSCDSSFVTLRQLTHHCAAIHSDTLNHMQGTGRIEESERSEQNKMTSTGVQRTSSCLLLTEFGDESGFTTDWTDGIHASSSELNKRLNDVAKGGNPLDERGENSSSIISTGNTLQGKGADLPVTKKKRKKRRFLFNIGKRRTFFKETQLQTSEGVNNSSLITENISEENSSGCPSTCRCQFCGKTCSSDPGLKRHITTIHSKNLKKRSKVLAKRRYFGIKLKPKLKLQKLQKSHGSIVDIFAAGGEVNFAETGQGDNSKNEEGDNSSLTTSMHSCHLCGNRYRNRCSMIRHIDMSHGNEVLRRKRKKRVSKNVPNGKSQTPSNLIIVENAQTDMVNDEKIAEEDPIPNVTEQKDSLGDHKQKQTALITIVKKKAKGKKKTLLTNSRLKCHICQKSFSRADTVPRHIKAVHMQAYNCVCVCKMGFKWYSTYIAHKKICPVVKKKQK